LAQIKDRGFGTNSFNFNVWNEAFFLWFNRWIEKGMQKSRQLRTMKKKHMLDFSVPLFEIKE